MSKLFVTKSNMKRFENFLRNREAELRAMAEKEETFIGDRLTASADEDKFLLEMMKKYGVI